MWNNHGKWLKLQGGSQLSGEELAILKCLQFERGERYPGLVR